MRAAAVLLLFAAMPALAQDAVPVDAGGLAACLAAPGDDAGRAACAKRLTDICLASPAGQTTLGMESCLGAETGAWDKLLNRRYAALLARDKAFDRDRPADSPYPPRAPALQKMQRAWIAFRDASCGYAVTTHAGGSIAGIVHGQCLRDLTADQARRLGDLSRGLGE